MSSKVLLNSGHEMPTIGLGTFQGSYTDSDFLSSLVCKAIEVGYRMFDTAYVYKTEISVGNGIKKALDAGFIKSRNEVFIITKLWPIASHPKYVKQQLEESLKNLQLDYVDMYMIHWPVALKYSTTEIFPLNENGDIMFDDDVDYVDTWKAMESCFEAKLAKSIAISNFRQNQVERILATCSIPPACLETEINPFCQDSAFVKFCKSKNIFVLGYSNFTKGSSSEDYQKSHNTIELEKPLNFNKYKKGEEINVLTNSTIKMLAEKYKKTPGQIILKFLNQEGIGVIPKCTSEERLRENLIDFSWSMAMDDIEKIRVLDKHAKLVWIPKLNGSKYYPFYADCA